MHSSCQPSCPTVDCSLQASAALAQGLFLQLSMGCRLPQATSTAAPFKLKIPHFSFRKSHKLHYFDVGVTETLISLSILVVYFCIRETSFFSYQLSFQTANHSIFQFSLQNLKIMKLERMIRDVLDQDRWTLKQISHFFQHM